MTITTDPDAITGQPRRTVIRYRNLGGALVTVDQIDPAPGESRVLVHLADCSGCLWQCSDGRLGPIRTVREEAVKHAATCKALPPIEAGPSIGETYLAEAHKLIEAAREARMRPAEQGRAELLVTVANSMVGFALAAHQIEAC